MVALLWPFYGYIALSFIFFMGSVLLLFSSICQCISGGNESYLEREGSKKKITQPKTVEVSITFWIFYMCATFLSSSIMGLMLLMDFYREHNMNYTFYYSICGVLSFNIVYISFNFQNCKNWFLNKMLMPPIIEELV